MKGWQKVFSTEHSYRANIVKSVLEDHEMTAVVMDKKDSSYHFGSYEVYVTSEHVLDALKIIENDIDFK